MLSFLSQKRQDSFKRLLRLFRNVQMAAFFDDDQDGCPAVAPAWLSLRQRDGPVLCTQNQQAGCLISPKRPARRPLSLSRVSLTRVAAGIWSLKKKKRLKFSVVAICLS